MVEYGGPLDVDNQKEQHCRDSHFYCLMKFTRNLDRGESSPDRLYSNENLRVFKDVFTDLIIRLKINVV